MNNEVIFEFESDEAFAEFLLFLDLGIDRIRDGMENEGGEAAFTRMSDFSTILRFKVGFKEKCIL